MPKILLRLKPVDRVYERILGSLAARNDSEAEQAFIRLVLGLLAAGYIFWSALHDGVLQPGESTALVVASTFQIFSFTIMGLVLFDSESSPLRRIVGAVGDTTAVTAAMLMADVICAPLYIIYLWVTFGNGFRYGRLYLAISACLSIVGFSMVISNSAYWGANTRMAIGLLVGLAVLPAYVSGLLKELVTAVSQANEANRAKSVFLANMSHEVRTPLTAILGGLDLIEQKELSTTHRELVRTATSAAKNLHHLVDNLLDMSKIEAGKIVLEEDDFDLHVLVKELRDLFDHKARAKGLAFSCHVSPSVPFALGGDPTRIRQVLTNLMDNAVKFTDRGAISLSVTLERILGEKAHVKFEVVDTGIGMEETTVNRVFDRFSQADDSITRRFGGTGLGLAISRQLVELMGSEIQVLSRTDVGTTFWFTLPLEIRTEGATIGGIYDSGLNTPLLVSGDPASTSLAREWLASWGYRPKVVGGAMQAFSHLVRSHHLRDPHPFAVIFDSALDIPAEVLASMVKSDPSVGETPLLLVTESRGIARQKKSNGDAFTSVIEAPLDKNAFFNAVHFIAEEIEPLEGDAPGDSGAVVMDLTNKFKERKLRVLLADDSVPNQRIISRILEKAGHVVHTVPNGDMALEAIENHPFDAAILDLHMPEMSGTEVARAVKYTTMGGKKLPLIALTADTMPESRRECEEAGFDAFVNKPVDSGHLLTVIKDLTEVFTVKMGLQGEASEVDLNLGDETPVLDPVHIAGLEEVDDDRIFVRELLSEFLLELQREFEASQGFVHKGDIVGLRESAHKMKSGAATVGATALCKACEPLEKLSREQLKSSAPALLREVGIQAASVRAALAAYLGERLEAMS